MTSSKQRFLQGAISAALGIVLACDQSSGVQLRSTVGLNTQALSAEATEDGLNLIAADVVVEGEGINPLLRAPADLEAGGFELEVPAGLDRRFTVTAYVARNDAAPDEQVFEDGDDDGSSNINQDNVNEDNDNDNANENVDGTVGTVGGTEEPDIQAPQGSALDIDFNEIEAERLQDANELNNEIEGSFEVDRLDASNVRAARVAAFRGATVTDLVPDTSADLLVEVEAVGEIAVRFRWELPDNIVQPSEEFSIRVRSTSTLSSGELPVIVSIPINNDRLFAVLPVGTYIAELWSDGRPSDSFTLLGGGGPFDINHGERSLATAYVALSTDCNRLLAWDPDVDGDGVRCLKDCDDTDPACTGCEDIDNDDIPDCKDSCVDADGDGYGLGSGCAGLDCDDASAACHDCSDVDRDGIRDCEDPCLDEDKDGAGVGDGCAIEGGDCADTDPNCWGCVDSDNDNVLDCLDPCVDVDRDGYGVAFGNLTGETGGTGNNAGNCFGFDCNDNDPNVNPEANEIPNNAVDENCDEIVVASCFIDQDEDGVGGSDTILVDVNAAGEICTGPGESQTTGDCNDSPMFDGADCTEDCIGPAFYDADGDGAGNSSQSLTLCTAPEQPLPFALEGGDCDDLDPTRNPLDKDGDGVSSCDGDCNDRFAGVAPGLLEICDGRDNDCDGLMDNVDTQLDGDGDGYPICLDNCPDVSNAFVPQNPGQFKLVLSRMYCSQAEDDVTYTVKINGADPTPNAINGNSVYRPGCDPDYFDTATGLDESTVTFEFGFSSNWIANAPNTFELIRSGDLANDYLAYAALDVNVAGSIQRICLFDPSETGCDPNAMNFSDRILQGLVCHECEFGPQGPNLVVPIHVSQPDIDGDGVGDACDTDSGENDCSTDLMRSPKFIELCDNGIDDDCNGLIDSRAGNEDPACQNTCVPVSKSPDMPLSGYTDESGILCRDSEDNDCDGLVDGFDPGCIGTSCNAPVVLGVLEEDDVQGLQAELSPQACLDMVMTDPAEKCAPEFAGDRHRYYAVRRVQNEHNEYPLSKLLFCNENTSGPQAIELRTFGSGDSSCLINGGGQATGHFCDVIEAGRCREWAIPQEMTDIIPFALGYPLDCSSTPPEPLMPLTVYAASNETPSCDNPGGSTEVCDLVDNDCDGMIDEDLSYADPIRVGLTLANSFPPEFITESLLASGGGEIFAVFDAPLAGPFANKGFGNKVLGVRGDAALLGPTDAVLTTTNAIPLTSESSVWMSFKSYSFNQSDPGLQSDCSGGQGFDNAFVEYSHDAGITWTSFPICEEINEGYDGYWRKHTVEIPGTGGPSNLKIRFRFVSNGVSEHPESDPEPDSGWYLDEIVLRDCVPGN